MPQFILLLFLALVAQIEAAHGADITGRDRVAAQLAHTQLSHHSTNDVRCVWFLFDRLDGGMMWMTVSLSDFSVQTVLIYDEQAGVTQHFHGFLANCGTNEIRAVWFLYDTPGVGMVMTLNLADYSVYTVRDTPMAQQCAETRKLSHSQVLALQRITGELPPSEKEMDFGKAVSVSFRKEGKVEVFQYDRRRPPSVVERLYDIGGGYLSAERRPYAPPP